MLEMPFRIEQQHVDNFPADPFAGTLVFVGEAKYLLALLIQRQGKVKHGALTPTVAATYAVGSAGFSPHHPEVRNTLERFAFACTAESHI